MDISSLGLSPGLAETLARHYLGHTERRCAQLSTQGVLEVRKLEPERNPLIHNPLCPQSLWAGLEFGPASRYLAE